LAAFIGRRYRAILAGSVVACLLSALSLFWLRLDLDVLEMLPRGRPAFDDFKAFVAEFGQLDELLILLRAKPGAQVSETELQAFAGELGAQIARLDSVEGVQTRIDTERLLEGLFGQYLVGFLPESAFDEIARRLTPEGIEAQLEVDRAILSAPLDLTAARWVREDPLGLRRIAATEFARSRAAGGPSLAGGYIMTPGGDALLMFVRPKEGAFNIAFTARLMQQVHDAEAATRQAVGGEGIDVAYTGGYAFALEDAGTMHRDVLRYTLLALLGVLAVFYAGYRNLSILPFVTYPLIFGTLVTFLADLLVFGRLNAVSTSFAAILYGLSIDTGIHFYNRLLEERRRLDLEPAIARTLSALFLPVLAASTTSAIAFAVIGFSSLSGVSQLGVLTAFGVLLNPLQLLVLYPALAFLLPGAVEARRTRVETPRLAALAETVSRHSLTVTVIAALAGAVLLAAALRVGFDVSLMHLRPSKSVAAQVHDEIEKRFGKQVLGATVVVRRADLESALADTERVVGRLESYEKERLLTSSSSVVSLLPSEETQRRRLARFNAMPRAEAMRTFRAALPRHGFVADGFEPFIAWFERGQSNVLRLGDPALQPLTFLLDRYIRSAPDEITVATYIEPASAESLEAVRARLQADLPGMELTVTGRPLLEAELGGVLRRELAFFLFLSLLGNFALLLATFGARDALVILVPVVWAAVALLAGMWLAGVPLNPVNLIAPTLILGLGVDYGAFVVARAREEGGMPAAIRTNGKALVVTGLTTVIGFGCLSLSAYPALSSMGLLAGSGLMLSLIASIVLLPALWAPRGFAR
jgi:predicted RND superfamily exporter protein